MAEPHKAAQEALEIYENTMDELVNNLLAENANLKEKIEIIRKIAVINLEIRPMSTGIICRRILKELE